MPKPTVTAISNFAADIKLIDSYLLKIADDATQAVLAYPQFDEHVEPAF
jgi:hypothetical protein